MCMWMCLWWLSPPHSATGAVLCTGTLYLGALAGVRCQMGIRALVFELGCWEKPDVTVNLTLCFKMLHKVCYQSFCTLWIGHLGTFPCTWVTGSGNAKECFVLLQFSLVLRQVRVSGLVYSENGACWIYWGGYTENNGISVFIMVDLNCTICVLF